MRMKFRCGLMAIMLLGSLVMANAGNGIKRSEWSFNPEITTREEKQAEGDNDTAQVCVKKEKRKKSFWKTLKSVISTIGDMSVATAEGLIESGLVSKESNAGIVISSSADITRTLRGENLQYNSEDIQSAQFGQNEKAQNKKEQYLVNEINSLQNKYKSLNNQANAIKNSKKTIYNQKSREASKVLKPTRAGDAIIVGQDNGLRKSRVIMSQSYAYNAKADKQLTEIYKEMSKTQQDIGKLKSQLSKLRNQNSESTTHQSTGHNNTKRECGDCHGLKTCSHCAGRGMKKNSKTGNWTDCTWCRGKGVCPVCEGRGYFTRDTTLDPVN